MAGRSIKLHQILYEIYHAESKRRVLCNKDLEKLVGISKATVSEHIDKLIELGLVKRDGCLEILKTTSAGKKELRVGIQYRGFIAAGPASPVSLDDLGRLSIFDFDETYFALRVRGNSMAHRQIHDGDLVILQKINSWLDVNQGDIVATLVPEGTDVISEEAFQRIVDAADGANDPLLDHSTLKEINGIGLLKFLRGIEQGLVTVEMEGNYGTVRCAAFLPQGVVVECRRRFQGSFE